MRFLRKPANITKLIPKLSNSHEAEVRLYRPRKRELELLAYDVKVCKLAAIEKRKQVKERDMTEAEKVQLSQDENTPWLSICPSLSEDLGAGILYLVANATESMPIRRQMNLISDSTRVEWVWLVNLDRKCLSLYRHGNWGDVFRPGPFESYDDPPNHTYTCGFSELQDSSDPRRPSIPSVLQKFNYASHVRP